MQKIILISDTHITKPGVDIIGLDPEVRLQTVLSDIAAHHGDADHLIFMGDLVHYGSRVEYRRFQSALDGIALPITCLPGNHDRRAGFSTIFGQDFGPRVIDFPHNRLICLDTLDETAPDKHSGYVSDDQGAWALDQINHSPKRCIVLGHHPLGPVGFDGMDAIALRNGRAVATALRDTGKVDLYIAGHVHRTVSGAIYGLPFALITSPCHQMPMVMGPGSSALSVDEPGGYGVLLSSSTGAVLHDVRVGVPRGTVLHDAASDTGPNVEGNT
ncbi:MAG: metallophosphoesterase [Pseudomonadota bacterium]